MVSECFTNKASLKHDPTLKTSRIKQPIVSGVNWLVDLPVAGGLLSRLTRDILPICLLHRSETPEAGVYGHSPSELGRFLDLLIQKQHQFLSLRMLVDRLRRGERLPKKSIVFTADDGYADQADTIAPVFYERQIPLTIFLITGFLDGELWPWDAQLAHAFHIADGDVVSARVGRVEMTFDLSTRSLRRAARRECQAIAKTLETDRLDRFVQSIYESAGLELSVDPPESHLPMTWSQARELEGKGVEFAPHTVSHRILTRLDDKTVRHELTQSWSRMKSELAKPLKVVAWPVGQRQDFGQREKVLAEELGFEAAVAASDRYCQVGPNASRFDLDRLGFPLGGDEASIREILSGLRSLKELREDRRTRNSPNLVDSTFRREYRPSWGRREKARSMVARLIAATRILRPLKFADLDSIKRLVFICTGNICRSPYAEKRAESLGFQAISCGLEANGRATADKMAVRLAFQLGTDLSQHRSTNVSEVSFEPNDLVVAMDPRHLRGIEPELRRTGARGALLGMWRSHPNPLILDPYGKSVDAFAEVFQQIDEGLHGLCKMLGKKE